MGGEGGGRVGTCELQAHEEGGEANKGGHMEGGAGAPGARYAGEHVVVRALGGHGPLFVVADFFSCLPVLSESRKRDINVVEGSMDVPESP